MVSDNGFRNTNDKLKAALEASKTTEQAANPDREQLARDVAERELLLAEVFAIPDQAERRRVLDLAGLNNVSAAPRTIEPIPQASRTETPQRSPREPRWPVWLALPKLKLWQCVALSLGIEPTDHVERSMRNGRQVNSRFFGLGVPGEFFDRLAACKQALSTNGPIAPQGTLYRGMLSDSGCPVLLKDVVAFLKRAEFEMPQAMAELVRQGGTVVEKVEDPKARQDRRLKRLRELGDDMRQVGDSWQTISRNGALAALEREEREHGRPMSDKSDIRKELASAAQRELDAQGK
jgi:hypothetical protein